MVALSAAASSVTHFSRFDVEYKDWAEQGTTGKNFSATLEFQMGMKIGVSVVFFFSSRCELECNFKKSFILMGLQKYPVIISQYLKYIVLLMKKEHRLRIQNS
jgi:hypothetical protein